MRAFANDPLQIYFSGLAYFFFLFYEKETPKNLSFSFFFAKMRICQENILDCKCVCIILTSITRLHS